MKLPHQSAEARSVLLDVLCLSEMPSAFFQQLRHENALRPWLAELGALIDVPQNPCYHPEGDVWNHTMLVVDAAAKRRDHVTFQEGFMLAALVHDFGKAICTETINGVIHSYGHETEGLPLIEGFLQRLEFPEKTIHYVRNLTQLHMKPNAMARQQASVKSTNRMLDQAVSPEDLLALAASDHHGRSEIPDYAETSRFLQERLSVYRTTMEKPHVTEDDLLAAQLTPAHYPELLTYAHKLRLAGVERESALKQVLAYARKMK